MNSPRMQIIRGLPGSGKTTLAVKRYSQLMRLETDMLFYRRGAYRFNLENNRKAVDFFMESVSYFCSFGFDFVVTGVFSAHTERLQDTIERALSYDYDVYIKTLRSQYNGIHAVPDAHLNAMKESFVPESVLRDFYKGEDQVHFGLMPIDYPLAHLQINRSIVIKSAKNKIENKRIK